MMKGEASQATAANQANRKEDDERLSPMPNLALDDCGILNGDRLPGNLTEEKPDCLCPHL
jgi:hypothetical protein